MTRAARRLTAFLPGVAALLLALSPAFLLPSCGKREKWQPAEKERAGKASPPKTRKPAHADPPAVAAPAEDAAPAEPEPASWKDGTLVERCPVRWYRREKEGRPTGYLHVRWRYVTQDGRRLVRDDTDAFNWHHRKIGHMNDLFETRAKHFTLRTETGELIETSSEVKEGEAGAERTTKTTLEKVEGGYRFTVEMLGEKRERFHPCEETIVLDAESFLVPHVRSGRILDGKPRVFHQMAGEKGTIHTFEARYKDRRSFTVDGKRTDCIGVEIENVRTGSVHREYFREDGLLVRLFQSDVEIAYSGPEEIRRLKASLEAGGVSLHSPVRDAGMNTYPDLPGAFNLKSLTVEVRVRLRPNVPAPPFQDSPFMEVVSVDRPEDGRMTAVLKLTSFDREGKVNGPYPLPEADRARFAEYLEPTALMQVDHPRVRDAAREAVGDASNARTAAERIAAYVFTHVSSGGRSGSLAQYSAVEILDNGFGDCSEFGLLFVALCRAAGIPARRVSGYVCLGSMWGNHAWAQIYIGDWIGADATTCVVGTSGRYIFFGYDDDPYSKAGVVSQGFTGYSGLRLLEGVFGDGEPVDLTGNAGAWWGTAEDGTAYNHLAGVALKKARDDWRVSAYASGLRLDGQGIQVRLSVKPDQGYRQDEILRQMSGYGEAASLDGVPAFLSGKGANPYRRLALSHRRRLISLVVFFRGVEADRREAAWNDFFGALDLTAWKGRPVEGIEDYPPLYAEAAPGSEAEEEDVPPEGGDEPGEGEEGPDSGEEDAPGEAGDGGAGG